MSQSGQFTSAHDMQYKEAIGCRSTRKPIAQERHSPRQKRERQDSYRGSYSVASYHARRAVSNRASLWVVGQLALDRLSENRESIAADLSNLSRIEEKQGHREAALDYGERAYRSYKALGRSDRAVAELTRAIRFAKELGYREKTERLGAELASEDRGPAQAK